jgi:hypothetical protein
MIDLNPDEQKVFDSVVRHGTSGDINPDCICIPAPMPSPSSGG